MTKKMYTLQIDETTKKTSAGSKSTKSAKTKKTVAQKEVESYGIVEINNAGASKKLNKKTDIGYEKNFTGEKKKAVKAEHSQVEDYFDFSFKRESEKTTNPMVDFLDDIFDEDFDFDKSMMELMMRYQSEQELDESLQKLADVLDSYAKENEASAKVAKKNAKVSTKAKTEKKVTEKKVTAKKQTKAKKSAEKAEETIVEKDNKTSTILKVVPEHLEEIRSVSLEAQVCDRFVYDDEAKYNISVARLGSLFDCEKRMLN